MLKELLDSKLEDDLPIPMDLLNEGLHTALHLNRPEAAEMLLSAGADTSIYKATGSDTGVADVAPLCRLLDPEKAWMQLLQSAVEDADAPYLTGLMKEVNLKKVAGKEGVRDEVLQAFILVMGSTKLAAVDGVSVDAELFMLLLLANRPRLARLMWLREEREDHALHLALLACVVCNGLAKRSGESDQRHALEVIRQVGKHGNGKQN
jgi:hypothetical protein